MTRNKLIGSLWDVVIVAMLIIGLASSVGLICVAIHFIRKFW